jgi:hypothetical protein
MRRGRNTGKNGKSLVMAPVQAREALVRESGKIVESGKKIGRSIFRHRRRARRRFREPLIDIREAQK